MKLKIEVEGRPYEVDIDFLDTAPEPEAPPRAAEPAIPPPVIRKRPPHKLPEDSACRAPMAGRVVAVVAAAGRRVMRNEPVVVLDAMKMEVPIGPSVEGTIKAIHVGVGDLVSTGQLLFELS
jgi:glutaconyl-CoA/methylmalonyl-CoA decarboxylase subunit gamma